MSTKTWMLPEDVRLFTPAEAAQLVKGVLEPRLREYRERAYRWGTAEAVSVERAKDEAGAEAAQDFLDLLTAAFAAPDRVVGRASVHGRTR